MAFDCLVVVRGGGDLGSGVALRLWRSGFPVLILESEFPSAVRRTVSFSEAVYDRESCVEEVSGRLVALSELADITYRGWIPVVVDPIAESVHMLKPYAVVDAILAKKNLGTTRDLATLVLGLGPGFLAGDDVHAVIETNRGPDLGRVLWKGSATPNTGRPGIIAGHDVDRVLRAPATGVFHGLRAIGDIVQHGDTVAAVNGLAVVAPFTGLVRGVIRDGLSVRQGMKIGDIDPRLDRSLVDRASDKSLAVAGGVLEAVLSTLNRSEE